MSLVLDQLKVQYNNSVTTYDIGANAINVSYDENNSVKDKIDELGTAAQKNVPESGNAAATEVVLGSDSRLTDARNAADVYAWAKAATKPSYAASEIGTYGVAELDSSGRVTSSALPSYVDDVIEYSSISAFPATGETGKIYVATDTNKTYRWGGTSYIEISESLAIGTTSSTAFAGDRGLAIEEKIPSTASSSNKLATIADIPSITVTSTDPGAGSALTTGSIVLVYEP